MYYEMVEDIKGVVFPLKERNLHLLKKRKNPVFVKYMGQSNLKNPRSKRGDFLFFYISCKDKAITHYSKIEEAMHLKPNEVKKRYMSKIQMKEEEFEKYIEFREEKLMLVLTLNEIHKLNKKIKLKYPITMAGKHINSDEVDKIL